MTILISPDLVPTGLRISAYRPPESGYASQVPNTLYEWARDPSYVSGPRLRTQNTGWGPIWEAGINIGTGRTIHVPRVMRGGSSPAWGTVEVGSSYGSGGAGDQGPVWDDPEWCCDWWDFTGCDADRCAQEDKEAAKEMAGQAGGGIVVDADGVPVAVVTGEDKWHTWGPPTIEKGEEGFEEALADAVNKNKKVVKTPKKGQKTDELQPVTPTGPGDWQAPSATTYKAGMKMSPAVIAGGIALVAAVYWFNQRK